MAIDFDPSPLRIDFHRALPAYALQFSTPGLNDHTYLVVVGDRAALIDPQRDYDRFLRALRDSKATLDAVFETHIHNDYISGGALAAKREGARYILPAGTGSALEHHAVSDGDTVPLGGWAVRAMHTPGHTPHHTSYVLESPAGPRAIFSGGSMLVGGVGRTDLMSPEMAEPLAHDQYRSVNRIANSLPDPATVGPTHGAGSFCGSAQAGETITTIGTERRRNSALNASGEDEFVRELLAGYMKFPDYYSHMAPANLRGLPEAGRSPLPEITPQELDRLAHDHTIVDIRTRERFAAAHIPGSVNIPGAEDVAIYAAWAMEWDQPVIIVSDDDADIEEARLGFARIGMDTLAGAVTDGLTEWQADGRTVHSYPVKSFADLRSGSPEVVLDVRDPLENARSPFPGAQNIHFSELLRRANEVPPGTVWVHCESGHRAAIGASLLASMGRDVVLVADGPAS